ncbi:MAG TPA: cyclase family protein [Actinomycetota bacterium]|nr:cyclase family protein [Actinomycetota bacterium]
MGTFLDLSHPLFDGMAAYPGLGNVKLEAIVDHDGSRDRYQGKAEFFLGRIEGATNAGTYLDSPFHRWRDEDDLASLELSRIAGLPGVVARAKNATGAVEIDLPPERLRGRAVLVHTGWSERWGTNAYWEDDPYLSTAAIDSLVTGRAALVGVDFGNVDDTTDPARPAHTRLLEAGVLIVESLTDVGALPDEGFRFTAVPPRVERGAAFPVRAFAELGA